MTKTTHHEDCTGWHFVYDDGRSAHVRRCNACNPDGQYPPDSPAPWTTIMVVDGKVVRGPALD